MSSLWKPFRASGPQSAAWVMASLFSWSKGSIPGFKSLCLSAGAQPHSSGQLHGCRVTVLASEPGPTPPASPTGCPGAWESWSSGHVLSLFFGGASLPLCGAVAPLPSPAGVVPVLASARGAGQRGGPAWRLGVSSRWLRARAVGQAQSVGTEPGDERRGAAQTYGPWHRRGGVWHTGGGTRVCGTRVRGTREVALGCVAHGYVAHGRVAHRRVAHGCVAHGRWHTEPGMCALARRSVPACAGAPCAGTALLHGGRVPAAAKAAPCPRKPRHRQSRPQPVATWARRGPSRAVRGALLPSAARSQRGRSGGSRIPATAASPWGPASHAIPSAPRARPESSSPLPVLHPAARTAPHRRKQTPPATTAALKAPHSSAPLCRWCCTDKS